MQFLFDKIDKFRKCRIHEMSSVVIFVELGLQTVGNTFLRERISMFKMMNIFIVKFCLLSPGEERVVSGAKLSNEATVPLCFLPLPLVRKVSALSLGAVAKICSV